MVPHFKGCSYSPPHKRALCEEEKRFCCSSYLVIILSKLLAARTEASFSYFLLLLSCSLVGRRKLQRTPSTSSSIFFSRRRMSSLFHVCVLPVTDRTFPFRCNAAVLWWRQLLVVFIRESSLIYICTVYSVGIIDWVVIYVRALSRRQCSVFIKSDICCVKAWSDRKGCERTLFVWTADTNFIMAVCLCKCVFSLVCCPWPQLEGSQTWWLSCFIRVWEAASACVAPQAQLYFYHRCRVKTLFCSLFFPPPLAFINFLCRTWSVVDSWLCFLTSKLQNQTKFTVRFPE